MHNIDARGMSCPQPVLMAKKAIVEKPQTLEVLVDNNTAKGNVERFLKNNGYPKIKCSETGETIILQASR